MSNGHYTALVDANLAMYRALERIAGSYKRDDPNGVNTSIACDALREANQISNCNGTTQPNNEQDACPGCGGSKSERHVIHNDPLTDVVCKHPWHAGNWHDPYSKENNNAR